MTTEDGLNVGKAFEAVRQCHQDVGRLIVDLDGRMSTLGWERIGRQNSVTNGISTAPGAPYWMADIVFRFFKNDAFPGVLTGISILFCWQDGSVKEPRLVAGRAKYVLDEGTAFEDVADKWDFDNCFCETFVEGEDYRVIRSIVEPLSTVERATTVAIELYSIKSLDDVIGCLEDVRTAFEAAQ